MLTEDLDVYLVGGAVRDRLIAERAGQNADASPSDRDWVVVGAAAQQLLDRGFAQIGKDFPVFLHPDTKEEYALARTERKRGAGHTGFDVDANPGVTLSEDLSRRDLTINAIAQGADGQLIDPHGGEADIAAGCLRHVSDAFVEDPLRVFRVARFAAQLPGFEVAPETQVLLRNMCDGRELLTLSAERVWQEFVKALVAPQPHRFFEVLRSCHGLSDWLPECQAMPLNQLARHRPEPLERFALLPLSADDVQALAERLLAPKAFLQAAVDRMSYLLLLSDWPQVDGAALFQAVEQLKALHDSRRLVLIMQLMDSPALRQRLERELLPLLVELKTLALPADRAATLKGAAYGEALTEIRVQYLNERLAAL